MTSDKQRELTPVLPKKERKTFFFLIAFLALLALSINAFFRTPHYYFDSQAPSLLSFLMQDKSELFIRGIVPTLSLFLSILGIAKKNYRLLATAGCVFLIAAQLCLVFGRSNYDSTLASFLLLFSMPLLIPAINERICQLGPQKTAHRRLCFAYALISIFFVVLPELLFLNARVDISPLIMKLIFLALALLSILLYWSSMIEALWTHLPKEEKIIAKASHSTMGTRATLLKYMLILYTLFLSIINSMMGTRDSNSNSLIPALILAFCFGVLLASYWSKNTGISRIIHRVAIIFVSTTLVFSLAWSSKIISLEALPTSLFNTLILINAAFVPLCLANCRRDLIEQAYPQNKGWIHLLLLLSYPASFICLTLIFSLIYASLKLVCSLI